MIKQYVSGINSKAHLMPAKYSIALLGNQGDLAFIPISLYVILCVSLKPLQLDNKGTSARLI